MFVGVNSFHIDLMSVTVQACSAITTHCFYFSPPVVIQVFCNVVFEFYFISFLSFCTNVTHQGQLLDKFRIHIGRKQSGPHEAGDQTFF